MHLKECVCAVIGNRKKNITHIEVFGMVTLKKSGKSRNKHVYILSLLDSDTYILIREKPIKMYFNC